MRRGFLPHGATAMHAPLVLLERTPSCTMRSKEMGSATSVACRLHALQSEASKFPGTLGSGLDAGVFGMDQDSEQIHV